MKTERKVLVLVAFPLSVALVCAQDASANYLIPGSEQVSGNQLAYTIGIANLTPNDSAKKVGHGDAASGDWNSGSTRINLLAAATPTTTDSDFALATVSDQLKILEKLFFDQNYLDQSHSERLGRLEMVVFRAHQEGSDTARLKKLIAALPADTKTQVTTAIANLVAAEPTVSPIAPAQSTTSVSSALAGAPVKSAPDAPSAFAPTPVASPTSISLASTPMIRPVMATPGATSSGSKLDTSAGQLGVLENFFFESTYPNQSDSDRLARIETLVYGAPKSGNEMQRLRNIISALPPNTRAQVDKSIVDAEQAAAAASQTAGQSSPQVAMMQPAGTVSANPTATAPVQQANSQATVDAIYGSLQKLVKKYYPNAKIAVSGTKIHFEYKCKTELGYYSQRKVYAPDYGGILGDVSVQPGQYNKPNKNRLPSEVADGFHTNLTMAPFSSTLNENLLTQLSFPPDMDLRFKGRFEAIINRFSSQDQTAKANAKTDARLAVAEHSAANKAAVKQEAQQASLQAEISYESAFGAPNMSEHNFPAGQFRVMFPDDFKTKFETQIGLADTTYSAPGTGGTFEVSFLQLPSLPQDGGATNALFDKMMNSLVHGTNGTNVSQGFTTLKGSPGRQINVGSISGKPGYGALFRIYVADLSTYSSNGTTTSSSSTSSIAGNTNTTNSTGTTTSTTTPNVKLVSPNYMLYVLSAVGQQDWLSSPAVANFLQSFEFRAGSVSSGQWTDASGLQHWQDQNGWEHWRDRMGQEHMWNAKHQDQNLGFANWGKTPER